MKLEDLDFESLLDKVEKIAVGAGQVILDHYSQKKIKITIKSDSSPVTDADLRAHSYIVEQLNSIKPKFTVISEEGFDLANIKKDAPYWLVDPLDGTKEFIEKTDEFTVNIALIKNFKPILGVIYVPVKRLLYGASPKKRAYKINEMGHEKAIKARVHDPNKMVLLRSRRHSKQSSDSMVKNWPNAHVTIAGSSYKFCLLAEGVADLYIRRGPTSIWDTGAGQCILESAGGKVQDEQGHDLVYDYRSLRNPNFWACGDPLLNVE